ncbi:MAG: sulfotransferase, partial [Halieaceae bacterium]|nr:sulfotransferase [Halieaceae bacterium]
MERAFIGFCRGRLEGYASALTDKPWLVDKSRGWSVHCAFLDAFYPNPKIVCMIRDPLDILCSMERLQETLRQGIDQQMLFIRHEDLCANPRLELERFYSYVGLPYYGNHDFNNVEQITVEDDEVYGVFGDRKIHHKVKSQPSQALEIFGP